MLGGTVKYFVVFGIDAVVLAHDDINIEIGINEFSGGISIIGGGQNNIAVAADEIPGLIIADVNVNQNHSIDRSTGVL